MCPRDNRSCSGLRHQGGQVSDARGSPSSATLTAVLPLLWAWRQSLGNRVVFSRAHK